MPPAWLLPPAEGRLASDRALWFWVTASAGNVELREVKCRVSLLVFMSPSVKHWDCLSFPKAILACWLLPDAHQWAPVPVLSAMVEEVALT